MNPIRKLLALPIAIFLSSGILIACFHPNFIEYSLYILSILFAIIALENIFKFRNKFIPNNTYLLYTTSFIIGYLLYALQLPQHNKTHFSHFLKQENIIQLEIIEVLKTTAYYQQYIAEIQALDSINTKGKVLLRVAIKDSIQDLKHKEKLVIKTNIQEIPIPLNPFEVDFRSYYRSLNIFHRTQMSISVLWCQPFRFKWCHS